MTIKTEKIYVFACAIINDVTNNALPMWLSAIDTVIGKILSMLINTVKVNLETFINIPPSILSGLRKTPGG